MKRLLRQLSQQAKPSRVFEQRLLQRLDAHMASSQHRGARKARRAWAAGALSVGFLLSGTGSYAYASPSVTPESPLYSVKSGIESVEERFYSSPESRAAFHARMADRRVAELKHVRRDEVREALRSRVIETLELSETELRRLEEGKPTPTQLRDRLDRLHQEYRLEKQERMDGVQTSEEIQERPGSPVAPHRIRPEERPILQVDAVEEATSERPAPEPRQPIRVQFR